MRYLTIVSLLTFLLTLPLQATALPALYEADIEVPNQQAGARASGMQKAMAAVLVKVSGIGRVAEEASLADAMKQPSRYVQQYSYNREEGRLLLHVRFDPSGIDELLNRSGINIWGNARPSTLIWLGVEDGGKRVLVGANDRGLVREIVEREATRRALPVKLPKLDSSDLSKVRTADVWGEFLETIKDASQPYAPHAILIGRVYPISASRWESRWTLDYRGEVVRWQSPSGDIGQVIAGAIDWVTDHMVSSFAQSFASGSGEAVMQVENVRNLKDYRRLVNYLKGTRGVKQVIAKTVTPEEVQVRIFAEGGIDSVLHTIAIGNTLKKMQRQQVSITDPGPAVLDHGGNRNEGKYSFDRNTPEVPESPVAAEPPQPELFYRLMP